MVGAEIRHSDKAAVLSKSKKADLVREESKKSQQKNGRERCWTAGPSEQEGKDSLFLSFLLSKFVTIYNLS